MLHDAGPVKQVGGQISDADILALRLPIHRKSSRVLTRIFVLRIISDLKFGTT